MAKILKKQSKKQLLLRKCVYDNVTDFEVFGSIGNIKSKYLQKKKHFFFKIKKFIHYTLRAAILQKLQLSRGGNLLVTDTHFCEGYLPKLFCNGYDWFLSLLSYFASYETNNVFVT